MNLVNKYVSARVCSRNCIFGRASRHGRRTRQVVRPRVCLAVEYEEGSDVGFAYVVEAAAAGAAFGSGGVTRLLCAALSAVFLVARFFDRVMFAGCGAMLRVCS